MSNDSRQSRIEELAKTIHDFDEMREVLEAIADGMPITDAAGLQLERARASGLDLPTHETRMSRLTHLIRKFESDCDATLLADSSPLSLAPDGYAALRHIRSLFGELDWLKSLRERRTVYISSIDMGINFWLFEALQKQKFFDDPQHHDINIRAESREWWQVLHEVREERADFGIAMAIDFNGLTLHPMLDRPHCLLMSTERYESDPIHLENDLSQLSGRRIARLKEFSALIHAESYLRENGVDDSTWIEVGNSAQLLSCVRSGTACAIVTPDAIPLDGSVTAIRLKPSSRLVDARDVIVTRHGAEKLNSAAQAVMKCVLSYWSDEDQWMKDRRRFLH